MPKQRKSKNQQNRKKNKNNGRANNNQPRRNAPRMVVPRRAPGLSAVVRQAQSLLDPFSEAAAGSKWPDESNAKTLPFQIRGMRTVTTDANGRAAMMFLPFCNGGFGYCNTDSIDGTNAVFSTAFNYAITGTFRQAASAYRLVSAGIKVRSIASLQDSKGFIIAREVSPTEGVAGNNYNVISYMSFNDPHVITHSLRDDDPLTYTFRAIGPTAHSLQTAPNDVSSSLDLSLADCYGWAFPVVAFSACPASTAVAIVEYVFNVEFTFDPGHEMNRLATNSHPANKDLTQHISNVLNDAKPFSKGELKNDIHNLEAAVGRKAKNKLGSLEKSAMRGLAGLVL